MAPLQRRLVMQYYYYHPESDALFITDEPFDNIEVSELSLAEFIDTAIALDVQHGITCI